MLKRLENINNCVDDDENHWAHNKQAYFSGVEKMTAGEKVVLYVDTLNICFLV